MKERVNIRHNITIRTDAILYYLYMLMCSEEIDDEDSFLVEIAMGRIIAFRRSIIFLLMGLLVTNLFWIANYFGWL